VVSVYSEGMSEMKIVNTTGLVAQQVQINMK
jgi:hypothetical protein